MRKSLFLRERLARYGLGKLISTMNGPDFLADFHRHIDALVQSMQTPEAMAGVDRLFAATPEELGATAVRVAQKRHLPPIATSPADSDS